jgi:catechol 2,3-dioxygenase-like lactoylglutathione lyase family enzyme
MSARLITGLRAVRLFVATLERAVTFYRDTLELKMDST